MKKCAKCDIEFSDNSYADVIFDRNVCYPCLKKIVARHFEPCTVECAEPPKPLTANILGEQYTIKTRPMVKKVVNLLLMVTVFLCMAEKKYSLTQKIEGKYKKFVTRHECVHAFFLESGLPDYYHDERLVNWIAYQFPKMFEAFRQVDAL